MLNLKMNLTEEDKSRIVEMAWEDRTTFESIKVSYGLDEPALMRLMKASLKLASYKLWRERVKTKSIKHEKLRVAKMTRAYCPTQYKISR